MSIFSIDSYNCPDPVSFEPNYKNLYSQGTGLSENGHHVSEVIRYNVAELHVKWSMLDQSDAIALMNAVEPQSFEVSWPSIGGVSTMRMYCEDKKVSMKCIDRVTQGGNIYRWDVEFVLKEI